MGIRELMVQDQVQ